MTPEDPVRKLEDYILHPDPFHALRIPKRLSHETVAAFIRSRVGPGTSYQSLLRTEQVVTFYDLQEVCGHLFDLLPAGPMDNQVTRPAVVTRIIAATCAPPEVRKASAYFDVLVPKAATSAEISELIGVQNALGPERDSRMLAARVGQLADTAAARGQTDYQARLEAATLDEILSLRLPRLDQANAIRSQVLAIPDRRQRIAQEAKMYLTLEYGYLEYLIPWAAARLRRETWADTPAQQVARNEDAARRAELAQSFLALAAGIDRLPDVAPENHDSLRIRCLRAAEYFGAPLSEEQRDLIREKSGGQVDLLSND